jgi:hypothetical protein
MKSCMENYIHNWLYNELYIELHNFYNIIGDDDEDDIFRTTTFNINNCNGGV